MHVLCALVNVVETDTEFLLSIPFIKLKMYGNIFFFGGGANFSQHVSVVSFCLAYNNG